MKLNRPLQSILSRLFGARSLRRDRRGVTAVEFALIATPMLIMTTGTIEFGRLLWTMQAVQAVAAEAARCMSVLDTACAASGAYSESNTITYITTLGSAWGLNITATELGPKTAAPDRAATIGTISGLSEVQISYPFVSPLSALLPGITGSRTIIGVAYIPNWQ
jgi:Flp pilus assembly protein TadG